MRYYLSKGAAIKRLEAPSVYHTSSDELYELDDEGVSALIAAAGPDGSEFPDGEFTRDCVGEGILTPAGPRGPHPPVMESPAPSLRYLELQVTDRCNLRCGHCYLGKGGHADLAPERIRRVLAEFERMQGLRVMLTGGEPLMHPHFDEINRMLPEFGLRFVLFTNGTLLDRKRLSLLNAHEIQVSIDGMAKAHDSLRGEGSFDKAMRAIREALGLGMQASVSTMVHRGNLRDFDAMNALFVSLGIRDWTVDVPVIRGALAEHPEFSLGPEEAGPYFRYGFGKGLHGGGDEDRYGCGRHLMAVTASGRCAKCLFYASEPVGEIDEGLAAAWARVPEVRLDALECDCESLEDCRGGCRYRAGGPFGRDLYKCAYYDKIRKDHLPEGGVAL